MSHPFDHFQKHLESCHRFFCHCCCHYAVFVIVIIMVITFMRRDCGSVDDAAPFSRGIQGIVFHRKSTQTNYVECSDQVRANQFLTGRAVGEVMEQYSQTLGQRG